MNKDTNIKDLIASRDFTSTSTVKHTPTHMWNASRLTPRYQRSQRHEDGASSSSLIKFATLATFCIRTCDHTLALDPNVDCSLSVVGLDQSGIRKGVG
jgi:hypothetical protein